MNSFGCRETNFDLIHDENARRKSEEPIDRLLEQNELLPKVENLFNIAITGQKRRMAINIDYYNEYLLRSCDTNAGVLSFFVVDDLLESLNLRYTHRVFHAESGFDLSSVRNCELIRSMYRLGAHVYLFDTILEKLANWYKYKTVTDEAFQFTDEMLNNLWAEMGLSGFVRIYKELYEGIPTELAHLYFRSTDFHSHLYHEEPYRSEQNFSKVIEYSLRSTKPEFNHISHHHNDLSATSMAHLTPPGGGSGVGNIPVHLPKLPPHRDVPVGSKKIRSAAKHSDALWYSSILNNDPASNSRVKISNSSVNHLLNRNQINPIGQSTKICSSPTRSFII